MKSSTQKNNQEITNELSSNAGVSSTVERKQSETPLFKERIKSLLQERQLTQAGLAEYLETSTSQLSRQLSGLRKLESLQLERLAAFFSLTADKLVEGTELESVVSSMDNSVDRAIYEEKLLELHALKVEIAQFQAQLIKEQTEKAKIQENLQKILAEFDQAIGELDGAKLEASMAKEDVERLRSGRTRLEKSLVEEQNRRREGSEQIRRLTGQLTLSRREIRELKQQLSYAHIEHESTKQGVGRLQVALREANKNAAVNYDAYWQAEKARRVLSERLRNAGGNAVVGGLVGLGAGIFLKTALSNKKR